MTRTSGACADAWRSCPAGCSSPLTRSAASHAVHRPAPQVHESHGRRAFRYSARASDVAGCWTVIAPSNGLGWRMFWRAVRRGKVSGVDASSLRSSRQGGERSLSLAVAPFGNSMLISPGRARHRAATCAVLASVAHAAPSVGPVPRAPVTDSPALPPLHYAALHSDGRKLSRPSGKHRAQSKGRDASHNGQESNMAARLRPARTPALWREATPIAEGKALARDASHGQDRSNRRETSQLSLVSLIFHCASFVPERSTLETARTH